MAYKFDLEDFDNKLIEKLNRQGKPQVGGLIIERLRQAVQKRRLPVTPKTKGIR